MPNTCQVQNGQQTAQQTPELTPTSIVNFIEIMFDPINKQRLIQILHYSCNNLKRNYFQDVNCESLYIIQNLIDSAPHTVLLCCFFVLLNIDEYLKIYICKCDKDNIEKLSTFLISLRFKIISEFSMDESITTNNLVSTCFDTYIIS